MMKAKRLIYVICMAVIAIACSQAQNSNKTAATMKYNELTNEEARVILDKGTEPAYTGEYTNNKQAGTYICKQCNAPLYKSSAKFDSQCGWPSFDDEIAGAITRIPDTDGRRTEIVCTNCKGHLGHVFLNEGFTLKETRHCVNSISIKFVPENTDTTKKIYVASGCFWGTEYYFSKAKGVTHTAVGFMGGSVENPSYEEVCKKNTGHLETTEVEYDTHQTSYEELVKLFFETHDFTQTNGQGPDIGPQYLSCLFYANEQEKAIADKYIQILSLKGYKVATSLRQATRFWKAEEYHQHYYEDKGGKPYCHSYTKIF